MAAHPLRIVTYNVHHCCGWDRRIDPARLVRVLQPLQADLLALQELDVGKVRSHQRDQAREIADALGMDLVYCPTREEGGGTWGHALLSRLPLKVLKMAPFPVLPSAPARQLRWALGVQSEWQGVPFACITTHFSVGRAQRDLQAVTLKGEQWIGGLEPDLPLILCGDFNSGPASFAYKWLRCGLKDVFSSGSAPVQGTFPSLWPLRRIDHIFISRHFRPLQVRVPQDPLARLASDHLPLVAELEWRA